MLMKKSVQSLLLVHRSSSSHLITSRSTATKFTTTKSHHTFRPFSTLSLLRQQQQSPPPPLQQQESQESSSSSQQQHVEQQAPSINTLIPPKLIVLVGPPASGKGTQTRLLLRRYPSDIKVVSAEDTLREAAKSDTELSRLLKRGDLAPKELTDQLLQQSIIRQTSFTPPPTSSTASTTTTTTSTNGNNSNNHSSNEQNEQKVEKVEKQQHNGVEAVQQQQQHKKVIILEGYPRDVDQAKQFLAWFSDKKLSHLRKSHVIILHLLNDRENIIKRLQGRLIHVNSGRPYHVTFNPPKMEMRDDVTGEELVRREDDMDKNAILKRLALYREETLPMIDFLTEHEFDVTDIVQGDDDILTVADRIEHVLVEKGVLAPSAAPSTSTSTTAASSSE